MSTKKYFKLGTAASTFADPKSGLKIINQQVVEIDAKKVRHSKQVTDAIEGGHIKETTEEEYKKYLKGLKKSDQEIEEKTTAGKEVEDEDEDDEDDEDDETEDEDEEEDEEDDEEEEDTKPKPHAKKAPGKKEDKKKKSGKK